MKQENEQRKSRDIGLSTFFVVMALTAIVSFIVGTRSGSLYDSIAHIFGYQTSTTQLDLSSVEETYRALEQNYDGELDTAKLIDGASRGLVAAAGDEYTVFMSADEAEEFNNQLGGTISGIGAEIGVRNDQPTILRLLDNAPAQDAGLKALDVIVGVDGQSTKGMSAADTAERIRGEEGTTVKVTVQRDDEIEEFAITRAQVSDASVTSRVDGDVGYIKIRRFDEDTADLTRRAAEQIKAAGVDGVVLDLRDNGGGYLEQAQRVAGIWLDDKLVVTERKNNTETDQLNSLGSPVLDGMRTVVLVNGSSASASEIVAGALRDHDAAELVGEKTFGKGTVQQVIDLSDGRQLKVTIARWFTPEGVNLSENGLEPDVAIELSAEDMNAGNDPQLDEAKDRL